MLVKPKSKNSKHSPEGLPKDLLSAFETIVKHLTEDSNLSKEELANFTDTPVRALKGYMEVCRPYSWILREVEKQLKTGFPVSGSNVSGMITQGPITVNSFCPHHLFHVRYRVYVSYIPSLGSLDLGLSKLARISKLLGSRPVLQEQLANDIADVLYWQKGSKLPSIKTEGSAVKLIGDHCCMSTRGVKDEAETSVTVLRGCYWNPEMENKFYKSLEGLHTRV